MDATQPDPLDVPGLLDFYRRYGFVVLRGLLPAATVDQIEAECTRAQRAVLEGTVPQRYGSTQYLDARFADAAATVPAAEVEPAGSEPYVNYVEHVEELSPAVRTVASHPLLVTALRRLLGGEIWTLGDAGSGVIYQDARPGRESGYTRIGWHSDWQAMPSLDVWPGAAFTIHVDETSPANGFLRVVPGSHRWATPPPYRNINNAPVPVDARPAGGHTDTPPPFPMPLGFEKVPGEIALYADRGDVLLHDAYLWHAAARATDDTTLRRHVRAGYYAGDRASYREQFVKNAAR
ncbi:phytanoyl-CoA dioxygenase family protein [Frankia sp. Ag45/Mut15]|uniref:Phytanoyl-CoA dioxygenase family protein n=1 Tax=Frankia umida TaxID=573489 RepID=A0ABT0JT78_9ACTN|nr:phytanoyl-CoA dioxygenase family protein [Frankia umida]MCK9874585.1 phytanoyl-CoA dioxygenase family protein [Frankia umida]